MHGAAFTALLLGGISCPVLGPDRAAADRRHRAASQRAPARASRNPSPPSRTLPRPSSPASRARSCCAAKAASLSSAAGTSSLGAPSMTHTRRPFRRIPAKWRPKTDPFADPCRRRKPGVGHGAGRIAGSTGGGNRPVRKWRDARVRGSGPDELGSARGPFGDPRWRGRYQLFGRRQVPARHGFSARIDALPSLQKARRIYGEGFLTMQQVMGATSN
jgi:hypothetical protein